ncbi:MAG TPA: VOC family protein [Devosiaceae bacterium]|jgi:catechol-2,3-dioxygenase|nr:VOC family protein [Devosiaceae bacterium]
MALNHINLTVSDAAKAASFLTTYFGMRRMGQRGRNMIFLSDENRMVLALMKGKDAVYPGNFHIGFIQPDRAAVDAIYQRLVAANIPVDPPDEHHGYTFYVQAPGGFTVECLA